MCGIAGIVGLEDKKIVKNMIKKIRYRGPDSAGYFSDKNISLGMCRLSIIDLKKGDQPLYNEDKSACVVFNGEIYNFLSLRKELEDKGHKFSTDTDTEVIVHAYEEYKENFIEFLDGMFSFALYDIKDRKLILARDRFGVKPLYYYENKKERTLTFSSELKSILKSNLVKRQINKDKLDQFLTLRYVPGEDTILRGVKRLNPGEMLEFKDGIMKKRRYWNLDLKYTEVMPLLENSVKEQLNADVPLGIFLSGGLDSSTIVALASKFKENINTYSLGFQDYSKNELPYARLVSEKFATKHKEIILEKGSIKGLKKAIFYCDEPVADPTILPTLHLSKTAAKDCKVILTGEGCDEIFGGYEQYKIMKIKNIFNRFSNKFVNKTFAWALSKTRIEFLKSKLSPFLVKAGEEAYQELLSIFNDSEKSALYKNIENTKIHEFKKYFNDKTSLLNQQLFDLNVWLPNNMLIKLDRMTMAASIEARVPFLKQNIVESALSLPDDQKLRFLQEKYYLKNKMKDVLPKQIIKRKKQRFFVPLDTWYNEEIIHHINNILEKPSTIIKESFDPQQIKKLIHYKESASYRSILKYNPLLSLYYARQLWTITTIDLWHKIFIEGEKVR